MDSLDFSGIAHNVCVVLCVCVCVFLVSVQVLKSHAHMLGRGLMVETPSIQQILSGNISVITDSNEQKFLQDFLESKSETPGGRLAWYVVLLLCLFTSSHIFCVCCSWLQPDRAVNPKASELVFPNEPVKTGVVSVFTVCTKDQEGTLVYVEGMKVSCCYCMAGIARAFGLFRNLVKGLSMQRLAMDVTSMSVSIRRENLLQSQ